ncbi:hypothetical protein CXB51_036439 [Gossypium anomalum]|uniref:Origin of replication complex subunit 4 n=1 Tax=Gossypium anomalum TaxID=47600 RepID=A0A8J5XYH6_9ROSI|nr:hypothetical protein CXB51_036439 [Gossypium anomalum]
MGREKEKEKPSEKALNLLRSRLFDPNFIFRPFSDSPDSNYSKLKFIISTSVTEACNNSILLLGPRGSGKVAVLELVLSDLLQQYPEAISVIRLNGLLHSDDNCALKEIARQLCMEHQLLFSKVASFDDNSQFMIAMLRECGLAHKTIIFVLDEFDFFAQGKQRLLYSLLDAMQSVTSQAVVIGVSCRLDVDQLLEKRVRSRFSHRKLLFLSPSKEDTERFMEHILSLPMDSSLPHNYAAEFNGRLKKILSDERFKELIDTYLSFNFTIGHLVRFQAVSYMDLNAGFLSLGNFKTALSSNQRQPKLESIRDCSVLELYMMAFEHLLQCQLISFIDNKGHNQSVEFRPVKLLISSAELHQGLKSYQQCPVSYYHHNFFLTCISFRKHLLHKLDHMHCNHA